MVAGPWRPRPGARCVVAFHGGADENIAADRGRQAIADVLGAAATDEPCGHFQVVAGERHWFGRPESWAEVYAAIVTVMRATHHPSSGAAGL